MFDRFEVQTHHFISRNLCFLIENSFNFLANISIKNRALAS